MTAPNYREAYPRLNLHHAKAALLRNEQVSVFTDEKGRQLGEAFILDTDETTILLEYCLQGPYFRLGLGPVCLPIECVPSGVDQDRHFFRCRSCSLRVTVLFFKERWACAKCQSLLFRSQLIPSEVAIYERMLERRRELGALVASGRPHRMRHATFANLESELEAVDDWLKGNSRRAASAEHRQLITEKWTKVCDLQNGLFRFGYSTVGGVIAPLPY